MRATPSGPVNATELFAFAGVDVVWRVELFVPGGRGTVGAENSVKRTGRPATGFPASKTGTETLTSGTRVRFAVSVSPAAAIKTTVPTEPRETPGAIASTV